MAKVYEDKYNLGIGDIKSLAEFEGDKYSGILIKRNKKGYTYSIKYRNELNKVIKKVVKEKNMTKGKALVALNKAKNDVVNIKDGIAPIQQANKNKLTTLNEMADYYFTTHITKTATREAKRYDFHIRDEDFANKYIFLITVEELNEFKVDIAKRIPYNIKRTELAGKVSNYKNKTLSPKSISTIIALCKTVINYSIENGKYKGENPFFYIKKPKVNNIRLKLMSDEEIKTYFKALETADIRYDRDIDTFNHTPYRISLLFAILALTTGARVQTLLNIRIRDIDLEDNIIHLFNRKVDDEAYIGHIANDRVKELIKEIIINNGFPNREYLFCNFQTEKQYINFPNPVRRVLDKVININRSGDSLLTVRDFRNVFATSLINKKVDISRIQNLLNHKTPIMTARYAQMLKKAGGDDVKEHFGNII